MDVSVSELAGSLQAVQRSRETVHHLAPLAAGAKEAANLSSSV